MSTEIKQLVRDKARHYFSIPARKYINVFKLTNGTYEVTYHLENVEHKHLLTL